MFSCQDVVMTGLNGGNVYVAWPCSGHFLQLQLQG